MLFYIRDSPSPWGKVVVLEPIPLGILKVGLHVVGD
jgi:hypothetical protein